MNNECETKGQKSKIEFIDMPFDQLSEEAESELNVDDFAKFIVDRAGKSAVSIISTCAMDDHPYWRLMFKMGMADAISEDILLEDEFFTRMFSKPGLPHAHKIMDAYLQGMPKDRKKKLFSTMSLRKRGHHFASCLQGASHNTFCGAHILKVLKVLISHGMPLQEVVDQNFADIESAVSMGSFDFLKTINENGVKIPSSIIPVCVKRIRKSALLIETFAFFIDECGMKLEEVISSTESMPLLDEKTRSYLHARRIREAKIDEKVAEPEEDSFDLA